MEQGNTAGSRRWGWGRLAVGGLLGLAAVLGCTELLLRYGLGLGMPVRVQPDPSALFVLQPNQHHFRLLAHTDINEWSMRSPSFAMPKPPGTYRVMLLGDSMTYGTGHVDGSKIFATLLRQELPGELHQPVEILNASTGAWAPGNELGYLQSRGTFGSDLVVLVMNTGDMIERSATVDDVGADAEPIGEGCGLCELWLRYIWPRLTHMKLKQDAGTTTRSASLAQDKANVEANMARLPQFKQTVERDGARFAIVFLAMRAFVPEGAQQGAYPPVVAWARANGVPFVDVTGAETAHSVKEITLDGIHLSAEGNRVVATYLEQHWGEVDPARKAR